MATISNTPRPGYVWDSTDNCWYPIGVGAHSHNEIPKTVVDAKGDLIVGTAADTVDRLAVGTNGYLLTADSAQTTGLSWTAPPTSFGTLTAYTPTWTGITIGNGTFSDVGYATSGDLVWYFGQFKWGSTTSATGTFQLSLPVNALGTSTNVDGRQPAQVFGTFCDASTGYIYSCALTMQNASPATKVNWQSLFANGTYLQNQVQYIQNTVPVTQATDDVFHWNFFYRKA